MFEISLKVLGTSLVLLVLALVVVRGAKSLGHKDVHKVFSCIGATSLIGAVISAIVCIFTF